MKEFESTGPRDRYYDYCLWEYKPVCRHEGKWRSINLLEHSFEVAGAGGRMIDFCRSIRNEIGAFKTVWGVKCIDGTLSWELYFYDYQRLEREVSVPRVLAAIKSFAACDLSYEEKRPYFMFSIDLHEPMTRPGARIEKINVYLGNPGCLVSSGISYALTRDGLVFDNLYYFFDAKTEMEKILPKIACSAHLDLPGLNPETICWKELVECHCIVVANKRKCDGIYFSRITVDQLLIFLRRLSFPEPLAAFIGANKDRLDHMLYDVGFDYTMKDGKLILLKGSYYGVF